MRKLVIAAEPEGEILGMLRIGVARTIRRRLYISKSMLEASPDSRRRGVTDNSRRFFGVGKTLVARLIAESYN